MKKYGYIIIGLSMLLLFGIRVNAQMVGDCVFLKGKYVEVGIAPNGGYGSTIPAPAGYHPYLGGTTFSFYDPGSATTNTSGNFLGFVADAAMDGWTVGTPPYWGDFYLPGDPQEGWAIEIAGAESDAYIPAYMGGVTTGYTGALTGTNISCSDVAGVMKGVWSGMDGALKIRQTTKLDTDNLFFTVTVVLTNTGVTPLNNIYYIRTVDPDNDETRFSGDYITRNQITYQLPDASNRVLVSARGNSDTSAYLGLGTKDCRAKCCIFHSGGLAPLYPLDQIYNETGTGYLYAMGSTSVEDVGIGLVFNVGSISAGDSTRLTYAYILNARFIDSALDATTLAFTVNSSSFPSGDTINICNYSLDTAAVGVISSGFYDWYWSPDSFLVTTTGTSNVIHVDSIVGTITYSLTGVNLAGGCDTQRYSLTFTHRPVVDTLENPDTTICIGQSVQTRILGLSTLSYVWTPTTGVSNPNIMEPIITPSVTTTYFVTATATTGCFSASKFFTINVYKPPILSTDSPYVKTCTGLPVQLGVYHPADTIAYQYLWSPITYLNSSTIFNPIVDPLLPGDYTYTVNVNPYALLLGCGSTDTIHVHVLPNDFTLHNSDTVICLGQSFTANVTGGSAEFNWLWTPSTGVSVTTIPDATFTPTITTSYTLTATYAHCPDMVHGFNVEVDTLAHPVTITDTICMGTSDTFNLAFPGSGTYHFLWTPATDVNNDTIPNAVVTPTTMGYQTWTVNVRPNAPACSVNDIINIFVIPNSFVISPTDTAICRGNSVQVIATPFPLYTYHWIPTAGIATPNIINPLITPDTSAVYVVTATYSKCPTMSDTLRLIVEPNPYVYIGGNRFVCEYDTLHIEASVTPNWYTGYTYSWKPGTSFNDSTAQNVVFTDTVTRHIYITVSTSANCSSQDSALVTVYPGKFANLDKTLYIFCPGDTAILSPTGGVSYHWYPGMYISDSLGISPTIMPITTQSYYVVATSAFGCKDTLHFNVIVEPAAMLYIQDTAVTIYPGETYQINPQTNCTNFTWFPSYGLSNPFISDPIANAGMDMKYIVYGTTTNGCKASDSITIYVSDETILSVPNAFTPGTGINNVFKIDKRGIANLNYLRIFNRWGQKIFETNNIDNGWDGTFNGVPQMYDVYVYELEAITQSGKKVNKVGNLTLLR